MDTFTENQMTPQQQFILNARKGMTNWKYWLTSILSVFLIWQGTGIIPLLLSGQSHISNFILVFIPFIFTLIALFILVTRLHKKTFLSVITGRKYFDLKRMFFAMSVVAIFSIISLGIQLFSNPSDASVIDFNPPNIDFFIIAIIALILVPIQVSVEEIFFRGHLLQGFSLISKSKFFLILSTSCLFALLHITNPEPWEYGLLAYLSNVLMLGIFMSMITILDGGLELAIGFHMMNNLWVFLIVQLKTSVVPTPALFILDIPEFNLSAMIIPSVIQFLLFSGIFAWKYKWFYKK